MSTGRTTARPLAIDHCLSCALSSAFVPLPSTAKGVIASGPSHLTKIGQHSIGSKVLKEKTHQARLPNFGQDWTGMR